MKWISFKLFGVYFSFRLYNLIYTEGIRTGLSVKMSTIRINNSRYDLMIYPQSYNRKRGLQLRKCYTNIAEFLRKEQGY